MNDLERQHGVGPEAEQPTSSSFEQKEEEKKSEDIESRVEKEIWQHEAMYIKGSAVLAKLLGRGEKQVRDVDVFWPAVQKSGGQQLSVNIKA